MESVKAKRTIISHILVESYLGEIYMNFSSSCIPGGAGQNSGSKLQRDEVYMALKAQLRHCTSNVLELIKRTLGKS